MAMLSSSSSSSSSFSFSFSSSYSTSWLRVQLGVLAALLLCSLVPSASASAAYFDDGPADNLILQWNKAATSEHVLLHLAQLKVLKGIKDGRSDANPTAAAAYVSHFVLRTFHWEKQGTYDFLLQTQLRPLNLTKEEKIKARRYAIKVALPIVRGRITSSDYLYYPMKEPAPPNGPVGVYQFTPGQVYMLYGDVGLQPFFAKDTTSYIRAIRPPPVPSPIYNAALKEVREIGGLNGSTRTKEQDEILLFHAHGISFTTLPVVWYLIARKVLPSSISLYDTAYVLMEIAASFADGGRVIAGAKAEYFFWRPITAIRQGDSENKPVKEWTPTVPTFEDPEFPSGTAFVSKGGILALKNYFGTENVTFNLTVTVPFGGQNITRTYGSFSQYAEEMGLWRILCGNHYRFSVNAGFKIADLVSKIVSEKLKQQFK